MFRFFILFFLSLFLTNAALSAKMEDVSLQLQWKNQFEYAGFYAAIEKGYYINAGLNVTIKEYQNGTDIINDVLKGKSNYGVTYCDLIVDYLHGKPIIFLANFFKHSPLILITQPEIKLPSDLKGKRVMGIEDSLKSTAFLVMFKDFGMDINSFVNVEPTFRIDEFAQKKVDALVAFSTNELYELDKKGIRYNVINPSSYGTEFYDDNLFTSKDELINHPQRAEKFLHATLDGWKYALEHKKEIIDLIMQKYNTQHKSRGALEFEANQIQKVMNPAVFPIGSIDKRRVRIMADDFIEMGLASKNTTTDFEDFIYADIHYNTTLTQKEKEYLQSKGTLNLCTNPDWMPLESIYNGNHNGIAADIFATLKKSSSISMKLYETANLQESLNALKQKKCDIFTLAVASPENAKYMNFTDPYIKAPLVLSTKVDKPYTDKFYDLKGKKIGVVRGYGVYNLLHVKYPDIELVEVKNIHDGLQKVENGELYGYVDNLMVSAYAIQHEFTGLLKISSRLNEDSALSIATRKDEPILHDIFQKLLHNVSEKEKQQIFNNWIHVEESPLTDYSLLYKVTFGAIILLFAIAYRYRILSKYNKELEMLSVTDSLTGIYNRIKLNKTLDYEFKIAKRYKTVFGIIIIDIDHFKEINDVHGHSMGDTVLQQFANLIKSNIRETDVLGRWGGEEFVLICPKTDIEALQNVAESLRNKIEKYNFADELKTITASFGIVCYKEGSDLSTLLKDADIALYKAKKQRKEQGR
jgi:diguanylate cyclase (GGDEF)-like protein